MNEGTQAQGSGSGADAQYEALAQAFAQGGQADSATPQAAAALGEMAGNAGGAATGQAGADAAAEPGKDAGKDAAKAGEPGKDAGKDAAKAGDREQEGGEAGDQAKAAEAWQGFAEACAKAAPELDPQMLEDFAAVSASMGLAPDQARQLVDWQLKAVDKFRERQIKAGRAELEKAWGGQLDANLGHALAITRRVDQALGDSSFSEALGRYGVANDPVFIRGLKALYDMASEDALGAGHGNAAPQVEETPLQALEKLFK